MVKTRFAPSPSGSIHVGNARTALFNFLLAHSKQGSFLLRIEDSDADRSTDSSIEEIESSLRWLEFFWQEGPEAAQENGPYRQSQRSSIYEYYYKKLVELGRAYPCFCTEQELRSVRKFQRAQGKPPRYSGYCRHLTAEEIAKKKEQGFPASFRFKVFPDEPIQFMDLIKGEQHFNSNDIGDFIIRRSNGSPAFFFCNAIDDALMGVTHVIRGEDHLSNTPRQIMLLEALSLSIPAYGHMSLIVNSDGSPLSKRDGGLSVKNLATLGYFPQAVQNYLARLGHTYAQTDLLDIHTLARHFSLEHLSKSPARYDESQLLHWQKQAMLHLPMEQLILYFGDKIKDLVPEHSKLPFIDLMRSTICFSKEAIDWAYILFQSTSLEFTFEMKKFLATVETDYWETILSFLEQAEPRFTILIRNLKEKFQWKAQRLFTPLRLALTGRFKGPELGRIFDLLDREKIRRRIQDVRDL